MTIKKLTITCADINIVIETDGAHCAETFEDPAQTPQDNRSEDQSLAILQALYCDSNEAVGVGDFAEAMEIDRANSSEILEGLHAEGKVQRTRRGRGWFYTPASESMK